MKIIGVGCGPGLLTDQAKQALADALSAYGSDRAIALARPYLSPACAVMPIDDYKQLPSLPDDAVILSTGDPMLAGLGYLNGEVIPGISSLQVAAARLRIPLSRISAVVAHGHGHEKGIRDTIEEVQRERIVFLLADPKFNVDELYRRLALLSLPIRVALCENLAYPDERIVIGEMTAPPRPQASLYSLVIGNF